MQVQLCTSDSQLTQTTLLKRLFYRIGWDLIWVESGFLEE